jgi:hypothetical protein
MADRERLDAVRIATIKYDSRLSDQLDVHLALGGWLDAEPAAKP